eukprot:10733774-Ditylum_brightwellii.AAC.1
MLSNIFTKNCKGPLFERYINNFVGVDEYTIASHGIPKGRVLEESYDDYIQVMPNGVPSA